MDKELGTSSEMGAADMSSIFSNLKEAFYNYLGNFFSWLSTHQSLALIAILVVLGILTWFILRLRRYGKQLEKKVSSKDIAIDEKDALIEEQKKEVAALQGALSDQRGAVGEALLRTIMTLTGYDIYQLKTFFKFLTEIRGNPVQIADTQTSTMPKGQWLEEDINNAAQESDIETLLQVPFRSTPRSQ